MVDKKKDKKEKLLEDDYDFFVFYFYLIKVCVRQLFFDYVFDVYDGKFIVFNESLKWG